jgi:TolB-like protein/Tfp pilus assembly protein PilF
MTEVVIANLARVGGLRVISRTSTMAYKGDARQGKSMPQIARELNVDALVEGSILRAGDQVRVTVDLIDGQSDRHLWANSYERSLTDVLALQNDIARAVAHEIKVTLTPQEEARLAAARPVNPAAQEAYLRGRYFVAKATEAGIQEGITYFKRAINADPADARPYAGLADAYSALRSTYAPPNTVMPLAKAAAAKALQLDPSLPEGHLAMGAVLMYYDFDWDGADRELTRAIDLSPNLAEGHDYRALYLAVVGRHDEARAEADRALALDPLSLLILNDAGWAAYLARDYARTVEMNRKALDLDRNFWPAYRDLGLAYEKLGRYSEAIAALQEARRLDSNASILEMLAGAYAAWGKPTEARRVLEEALQQAREHYVCPYEIATMHASLGDRDRTLEWLRKGIEEHADCIPWVRSDPKLDMLRSDPRLQSLLRELGLQP